MFETDDLVVALGPVAKALEQLGVRFYIGGSVASSFHGATRSTMDVDLLCELHDKHVRDLTRLVGDDFYFSEAAMRDAIRQQSCFNLIHLPTSFKVDVFVSRGRPFDNQALERASPQKLGDDPQIHVPIASPEDVIVIKLEWFRIGNEVSERQWNDVTRLYDLFGTQLDMEHLRQAADSVGVGDLLNRLTESTTP